MKAHWKWIGPDDGWRIGSVVAECGDSCLMREYHTGRTTWVRADLLSRYPESPIPEPEARA